jgi:hypothetical protein
MPVTGHGLYFLAEEKKTFIKLNQSEKDKCAER